MDATKQEVAVFFRLDANLKEQLRGLAKRERRSLKEQLNHIIEQALASNNDAPSAGGSQCR